MPYFALLGLLQAREGLIIYAARLRGAHDQSPIADTGHARFLVPKRPTVECSQMVLKADLRFDLDGL